MLSFDIIMDYTTLPAVTTAGSWQDIGCRCINVLLCINAYLAYTSMLGNAENSVIVSTSALNLFSLPFTEKRMLATVYFMNDQTLLIMVYSLTLSKSYLNTL